MPVDKLRRYDTLVVSISPKAGKMARKIAKVTASRYEIMITEAITAPHNDEVAVAQVSETKDIVMQKRLIELFDIKEDFIYNQAVRKHEDKIVPKIYRYRKGQPLPRFDDKYVILADTGAQTGLSVMTAAKTAIALGAKNVYIAIPVMPKEVAYELQNVTDELFSAFVVDDFTEIEYYYETF